MNVLVYYTLFPTCFGLWTIKTEPNWKMLSVREWSFYINWHEITTDTYTNQSLRIPVNKC